MKSLFLLLIIYNLQNYICADDASTIIYKSYPKKVHPDRGNMKIYNIGSHYKKMNHGTSFTRFQPPLQEWPGKKKQAYELPAQTNFFPLDFQGDLKSRVKKLSYFHDSMRSKRALNESKPEDTANLSTTQKAEASKPKEIKPLVIASPKNATHSRRSASKKVKATIKLLPSNVGKPKTAARTRSSAKKSQLRSFGHGKKKSNHKRSLRKHKSRSRSLRAGNDKSPKEKTATDKAKSEKATSNKTLKGKDGTDKVSKGKADPDKAQRTSNDKEPKQKAGNDKSPKDKTANAKQEASKAKAAKPAAKDKPKLRVSSKRKPKASRPVASRRLISARDAAPEDYPYVVSIQKDNQHWCSGAILNPQLVVSTANCFWKSKAVSRMRVRAGAQTIDTGGQVANIAEVRKHPNWSIRKFPENDIALALLDKRFKFSDAVHSVDLPNKVMIPPFNDVWVTSYGAERRDGVFSRLRQTLQVSYMRIMPGQTCEDMVKRFGVPLHNSFFCVEQIGRRAPCTRDTGAPAVSDGILWGLASWGIRKLCGTQRFPAVFTYVAEQSNMNFLVNATSEMMGEERRNPFLDRPPVQPRAVIVLPGEKRLEMPMY